MVRTRVGYAGGTTPSPTYRAMGDHTEILQIDFDPALITFEDLLVTFWNDHLPDRPAMGPQYRSVVLCHDEHQEEVARAVLARLEADRRIRVYTDIEPMAGFTLAEGYHQKYYLQGVPALRAPFQAWYPSARALADSRAAARVNAYVGGYGSARTLAEDLPRLGLPREAATLLRTLVGNR